MATDTAFVIGCLAILGSRIPRACVYSCCRRLLLTTLAILVVAIGYSGYISWGAIALAAIGVAPVRALAVTGVRAVPVYFLMGGCIWVAVDASGIHATVTGVILGLLTPARRWVNDDRLYAILGQGIAHPTSEESVAPPKTARLCVQLK